MNPSQLEQFSGFVPKELIFNSTLLEARNEVQDRGVRAAIDELNATYKRAGAEVLSRKPVLLGPGKNHCRRLTRLRGSMLPEIN